jgi:hypothetical protein
MALPGLVIAFGMIGDTLLHAVLPLYHEQFGLSLAMVGVLLSPNHWIRLLANSGVAAIGEKVGPHAVGHLLCLAQSRDPGLCGERPAQRRQEGSAPAGPRSAWCRRCRWWAALAMALGLSAYFCLVRR